MKTTTLKKNYTTFTSYLLRCIILFFVLNTSIVLGQSNSCSAELKVENERLAKIEADGSSRAFVSDLALSKLMERTNP